MSSRSTKERDAGRQYLHTSMRVWARYGVELDRPTYAKITALVRSGRVPCDATTAVKGGRVFSVNVRGRTVRFVYHPKRRAIVTALPA